MKYSILTIAFWALASQVVLCQDSPFDFYLRPNSNHCGFQGTEILGDSIDEKLFESEPNLALINADTTLIVPVVVHIRHNYDYANVDVELVKDIIRQLNERFSLQNSDTLIIHPEFRKRMGNPNIEFRLATKDPDGNCTTGITRAKSIKSCWDPFPTSWDKKKYLNVYIVNSGTGSNTGGAYYPDEDLFSTNPSGIVLASRNYFKFGNYAKHQGYSTFTHEAGHYLGLSHTWGPTNDPAPTNGCDMDDSDMDLFATETPRQLKATTSYPEYSVSMGKCPAYPHFSCPNEPTGDNFNNYMDYSCCRAMFTNGQARRMRSILTSYRKELSSYANLIATGTDKLYQTNGCSLPPKASFSFDNDRDSAWIIVSDPIQFRGFYDNALPDTWEWTFTGGTPTKSSERNPKVSFPKTGIYKVELIVSNEYGSDTLTENLKIFVLPKNDYYGQNLTENFSRSRVGEQILNWAWTINSGWIHDVIYGNHVARRKLDLSSYGCPNNGFDYLHLPPMSLKGMKNLELTFKTAFAKDDKPNGVDGTFWVYGGSSTNLREHTQLLRLVDNDMLTTDQYFGSDRPADSTQWKSYKVNIPSKYDGVENFYLSFIIDNTDGSSFYLDDIEVKENDISSSSDLSQKDEVKIFPNPTREYLQIETVGYENKSFKIYNSFGQIVESGKLKNKLDIIHLPSGIFHILLFDKKNGQTTISKFVKAN